MEGAGQGNGRGGRGASADQSGHLGRRVWHAPCGTPCEPDRARPLEARPEVEAWPTPRGAVSSRTEPRAAKAVATGPPAPPADPSGRHAETNSYDCGTPNAVAAPIPFPGRAVAPPAPPHPSPRVVPSGEWTDVRRTGPQPHCERRSVHAPSRRRAPTCNPREDPPSPRAPHTPDLWGRKTGAGVSRPERANSCNRSPLARSRFKAAAPEAHFVEAAVTGPGPNTDRDFAAGGAPKRPLLAWVRDLVASEAGPGHGSRNVPRGEPSPACVGV